MPDCQVCGQETVRTRRNIVQRLYTRAVFKCLRCGNRVAVYRRFVGAFGRYTRCPQCGTRQNLSKLKSIDRVDRLNKNPLRWLLGVLGAPLYHCTFCRLQFWDTRSREPAPKQNAANG
jgi:hypothetical protein